MKTLTVKQPWATLLVCGKKTIETRPWKTKYRGTVAIHAGKNIDPNGPWDRMLATHYPMGVVVGFGQLVECRPMTMDDEDAALCKWRNGLYAWVFDSAYAYPGAPYQMRGQLGLYTAKIPMPWSVVSLKEPA